MSGGGGQWRLVLRGTRARAPCKWMRRKGRKQKFHFFFFFSIFFSDFWHLITVIFHLKMNITVVIRLVSYLVWVL